MANLGCDRTKNALHFLVWIDERELLVMANTRPDSAMYQDSLREHQKIAAQIGGMLRTCRWPEEDVREYWPRYGNRKG